MPPGSANNATAVPHPPTMTSPGGLEKPTAELLRIAEVLKNIVNFHVDDSALACLAQRDLKPRIVGVDQVRVVRVTGFAAYPPDQQVIVEPRETLSIASENFPLCDDRSAHTDFSDMFTFKIRSPTDRQPIG